MEHHVPVKLTGAAIVGSHTIKPETKWLLISGVLSLLVSVASVIFIQWFFYTRFITAILFMCLGYAHIQFTEGKISFLKSSPLTSKLKFTLQTSAQILLISLLCFLIKYPALWWFAFVNTASFLFPVFIALCFNTLLNIPEKKFKVWFNKEENIDKKVSIFLNSMPLQIRVTSRYFDIQYRTFYVTLPCQTKWGKLFDKFLADTLSKSDEPLEITDETGEPYGWQFTAEKGAGRKKLVDPELDLRQNKVHDNYIITAKRVKKFERILEYK